MNEEQLETLYKEMTGDDEMKARIMYMFLDVMEARQHVDQPEPEPQPSPP